MTNQASRSIVRPEASVVEPIVIGDSAAMRRTRWAAARAAGGSAKVLITGESRVGKDLVGRLVHTRSARARQPFMAINCAGLSEMLLESELFGHVRGSFTDAVRDKPEMPEEILMRIANDPASPDFNGGQLAGRYYFARTDADVGPAFQALQNQIIRLSK